MAEDHDVGGGSVEQAERHARETGVRERPLPFDDHPVGPLRGIADHELGRARDEVRDYRVNSDAAAGDRDPGLSRRDELNAFARAAQPRHDLERCGHLPDRGIRPDGEHDPRALAPHAMAADRQVPRRFAQLAHVRAAALRRGRELGIGEDPLVQSVPHIDAAHQRTRERGTIPIGDATAGGGSADEQDRRAARQRVFYARNDGHALSDADTFRRVLPRPRRVDDGDDFEWRVAEHPDRGLRGGPRELALGEDRDLHRPPRSRP